MIRRQRRLSYLVIHLFMFLSGVEYAVIFPTLWEYLISFGVLPTQTYWLGLCLSSMTVTDMVTGLVVGKLLDVGQYSIKRLVVLLNFSQIAGACLYLFSQSRYMILVSRLVSGLGKSITIAFLTDICRSTRLSERTPVLLIFNIAFQLGLLLGPGFNLILSQLEVDTALGRLDKLNSPGLFLGLGWAMFSVLVMIFYSDLLELVQRSRIQGEMDTAYLQVETESQVVVGGENCPLLYSAVDQSYPSTLPPPNTPPSQDLSSYQGGPAGVKLAEVPTTTNYGAIRAVRSNSDALSVGSRTSRTSRKSNIFINQAERLMRDRHSDSDSSQESDRESLDQDLEDVQLLPAADDEALVSSQSGVRGYFPVLFSQEMICLTYLR